MKVDMSAMLPPAGVATLLGMNDGHVRRLIRQGRLLATNVASCRAWRPRYLIHVDDLNAFLVSRKVGRGGQLVNKPNRPKRQLTRSL
jgi:hypothetical protein